MKNKDIANSIEAIAPLHLQESYDNCGFQVGNPEEECSGVLICVDATEEIIQEAIDKACNLVVTHHPLLFHAVKQVLDRNRMDRVLFKVIKNNITIYSCHTAIDFAPALGVSMTDAEILGLTDIQPLVKMADKTGPVAGELKQRMSVKQAIEHIKKSLDCSAARLSRYDEKAVVKKIAIGGGACGDFIVDAIKAGADIFVTSDCKHNDFIDHQKDIILMDLGHFDTEKCTKLIFYKIITEKFPNFAVYKSEIEQNPIIYC